MIVVETNKTKNKIIDAATALFNNQGYDGTSIREIAKLANVNIANISYYFNSKKGLLEYLITKYFEGYFQKVDEAISDNREKHVSEMLYCVIKSALNYQFENSGLTRFVYRELSLDTILVREIMSTYLMREKYIYSSILNVGIKRGEFEDISTSSFLISVKSFLSTPFLFQHYSQEVLQWSVQSHLFQSKYMSDFKLWINRYLCINKTQIRNEDNSYHVNDSTLENEIAVCGVV
jgi:AcrR family transcriptional regulator